jgi:hypothetical protein
MKPTYFPSHHPIHPPMEMLRKINTFFMPKSLSYFALQYLENAGSLQFKLLA